MSLFLMSCATLSSLPKEIAKKPIPDQYLVPCPRSKANGIGKLDLLELIANLNKGLDVCDAQLDQARKLNDNYVEKIDE